MRETNRLINPFRQDKIANFVFHKKCSSENKKADDSRSKSSWELSIPRLGKVAALTREMLVKCAAKDYWPIKTNLLVNLSTRHNMTDDDDDDDIKAKQNKILPESAEDVEKNEKCPPCTTPPPTINSDSSIRRQQRRILLVRHAMKCQHSAGTCPVLKDECLAARVLCVHISKCREARCSIPHCESTRHALAHYKRCVDDSCPICTPVNRAIKEDRKKMMASQARQDEASLSIVHL